mgnify:CR=1 FL=1
MAADLCDTKSFHVIAHRGASAYAPENTMAAVRKAVVGADRAHGNMWYGSAIPGLRRLMSGVELRLFPSRMPTPA